MCKKKEAVPVYLHHRRKKDKQKTGKLVFIYVSLFLYACCSRAVEIIGSGLLVSKEIRKVTVQFYSFIGERKVS